MIKKKKLTIFQVYTETEIVCKYPEPLFRTQYSEHLVEYEKSFNIKTGNMFLDIAHPYQNREDEKSYIPVTLKKNKWNTGGKTHPENKVVHGHRNFH